MEKALLGHESSGGGSSSSRRRSRDASALFRRRSDAITHGSPYQKAAALVDLAEDGVGLPEQILDQSSFETAAKFYFIFTRFDILWSLNYFALIVLNFLEKPLWCDEHSAFSCNNREYYFLGQLPYLTGAESLVYEGVTLIILMIHTFFPISYEGFSIYWKSALNILKGITG
ncbi:two pore calcium channel protein 1A-like isoform X4 [Camellia sinensis]|uniref:two pore calcium channel protein 1A-like isoform X4 n=1 Tax=Camellia sinensis TaxID=4442 RepID=UPI0010361248|nr:two pore calcium channel protein 1A-like isoform X4 [Camellia sinensis]